jgi:hypothetical protein
MDQWDYEGYTLVRYLHHQLSVADLFAQHNESHLVLARLVALIYAPLNGWDVRFEVLLALLCSILIAVGLNILILRSAALTRPQQYFCVIVADAAALASTQWEVLLFGAWYFLVPGLSLIWSLVIARANWSSARKTCGWITLSLLATLSYINGLLLWLLLTPCVLGSWRKRSADHHYRFAPAIVYLTVGAVMFVAYLSSYARPPQHPAYGNALHWSLFTTYFLVWLGASFGYGDTAGPTPEQAGYLMLILFVAGSVYVLVRKAAGRSASRDWIILGGYVLLTGASITIGRAPFGAAQALASRYQSFSLLFVPALLPLLFICGNTAARIGGYEWSRTINTGTVFIAGAAAVLFSLSYRHRCVELHSYAELRHDAQLAVEFVDLIPDNPQLSKVHPNGAVVATVSRQLLPLHLPRIAVDSERLRRLVQDTTSSGNGFNGFLDQVVDLGNGQARLSGWAILKARNTPADCVLIVWKGDSGTIKPVSVLRVGSDRPDVAVQLKNPAVVSSGFAGSISTANISGPGRLAAWAVDTHALQAYQLGGTFPVSVPGT